MRITVAPFLWLVPFICFLGGYQGLRWLSYTDAVANPNVLGMHMHDALKTVSDYRLNIRILQEKEDPDMPEGVIISQSPAPGQKVKSHQSLFVVVTRKPPKPKTPHFIGSKAQDALDKAQKEGLKLKMYPIESTEAEQTVIAQQPAAQIPLDRDTVILYVSSGRSSLYVVPNFKDKKVPQVLKLLHDYGVKAQVVHNQLINQEHTCNICVVREQRPLAGSFIDLKKPVVVQLIVDTIN